MLARHYTTGGTRPPFFPLRWIRSIARHSAERRLPGLPLLAGTNWLRPFLSGNYNGIAGNAGFCSTRNSEKAQPAVDRVDRRRPFTMENMLAQWLRSGWIVSWKDSGFSGSSRRHRSRSMRRRVFIFEVVLPQAADLDAFPFECFQKRLENQPREVSWAELRRDCELKASFFALTICFTAVVIPCEGSSGEGSIGTFFFSNRSQTCSTCTQMWASYGNTVNSQLIFRMHVIFVYIISYGAASVRK